MVGRPGTGDSSKPWHGEVACLMAIDGETVVQTYALILKNFLSSYSTSTVMYLQSPIHSTNIYWVPAMQHDSADA